MLYHTTPVVEQFGLVRFRNWSVLELDSWPDDDGQPAGPGLVRPSRAELEHAMSRMAIIVPIRNERIRFLEGVLSGIPRGVTVIVISNSDRAPVDRFHVEREALTTYSHATGRGATLLHQRDPELGRVLQEAGYDGLLDDDGLVAHGKGQSMAVGVALALARGHESVGFIDSDNYVPGAVLEHVWNYAAGVAAMDSPHVCVRDLWHFKPKLQGEVVFRKAGRCSRVTNEFLNKLVSIHTGFETNEICTGNAGEHAMTAALARQLPLASGFAVETWELRWMLEQWGGVKSPTVPMGHGADVLQVETRNPHFHEDKGDDHIVEMIADSLGVLYHSPLANDAFRSDVEQELARHGWKRPPPEPSVLPAPADGDLKTLASWDQEARPDLVIGDTPMV